MPDTDTPPNVVLISLDSLRADHCGFLGDDRGLTPTMDRLAEEGVAFTNAIAPGPQTFSSMPAVFTGRPRPATTYSAETNSEHWQQRLAEIDAHLARHGSVAERLSDHGYTTAGFSPNPWMSSSTGTDRGFDHFSDLSGAPAESTIHRLVDRLPGTWSERKSVEIAADLLSGQSFFTRWENFYDDLVRTVHTLPEPYFVWVFLMDTHFPFVTGRSHREEQSFLSMYASMFRSEAAMRGDADALDEAVQAGLRRSYRDTVRAADAFLAALQGDLAADDPITVVHSDHGESFGEHGGYGHHHRRLYEENVHVPLLVHNAGVTDEVSTPTSLTSVHDALLTASRTGTIDPQAMAAEEVFTASECGRNRAVRSERFKYIQNRDRELLFDLERDPAEQENIATRRSELRREYAHSLESFVDQHAELDRLGHAASRVAASGRL